MTRNARLKTNDPKSTIITAENLGHGKHGEHGPILVLSLFFRVLAC